MSQRRPTPVGIEAGSKRTFAWALEWPGWCRSGRTEEAALEALASYAERYAPVAEQAGITFPDRVAERFDVVTRVTGDATTDFGAPGGVADSDTERLTAAAAARQADIVAAAWSVLDKVAAGAPAELRKGPRGGGRDRDKMLGHVLEAEAAYARKIGVRHKAPALDDRAAITALRAEILDVLRKASDGAPPVQKGWPVRYAARRIAWHALDHAWEMQDRS
jgi:hypothetical protein